MNILLQHLAAVFQSAERELRDADILLSDERIVEVGQAIEPPAGAQVIDCRGKVAIPGLINCHHHFFQILTRCLPGAQDAKLFDWLVFHYPVWRHMNPAAFRAANRLAICELLLTGCTTTSDHLYLFPQAQSEDPLSLQVENARELGIRYCGTRGSMSRGRSQGGLPPDDLCEADERVLLHSEDSIRRYHDPRPFAMSQLHLAPCSPFNVTRDLLIQTARLARKHGVRLHTHLAETTDEHEYCREVYGCTPLELMEQVEWLGPDVWFAHGVCFCDAELDALATARCGICHCPSSNMRLGSGVARVPEMLLRDIPLGLGVDGSASNDSSDMLGELRQAMLLARMNYGAAAMNARTVLRMATEGSARLLGRPELGRIEPGMAADIAVFDVERLGFAGAADPIAALLFCGFDHRAWLVMVNGRILVEKGRLTTADETQIAADAVREARAMWARSGVIR
ncbi:8-oxoguanine deaminase [candidate division KSB1 bacterium]|nr:8-oxoguanine deaminase [candidate division KSB1 bacterium]